MGLTLSKLPHVKMTAIETKSARPKLTRPTVCNTGFAEFHASRTLAALEASREAPLQHIGGKRVQKISFLTRQTRIGRLRRQAPWPTP